MEGSHVSRFTQTIQDNQEREPEKELNLISRYDELMALYQLKTEQVQELSDQLIIAQENTRVRFYQL